MMCCCGGALLQGRSLLQTASAAASRPTIFHTVSNFAGVRVPAKRRLSPRRGPLMTMCPRWPNRGAEAGIAGDIYLAREAHPAQSSAVQPGHKATTDGAAGQPSTVRPPQLTGTIVAMRRTALHCTALRCDAMRALFFFFFIFYLIVMGVERQAAFRCSSRMAVRA